VRKSPHADQASIDNAPPNSLRSVERGTLKGTQTITGVAGLNVICVGDVAVASKELITLDGPADSPASSCSWFRATSRSIRQDQVTERPVSKVLYNVIARQQGPRSYGQRGGVARTAQGRDPTAA